MGMHLSIRQYSGEADCHAYSWKDFNWIGRFRGLPDIQEKSIEATNGVVTARSSRWGQATAKDGEAGDDEQPEPQCWSEAPLELNLMNGTRTAHCCWEDVLH